jgi:hypothetical protein
LSRGIYNSVSLHNFQKNPLKNKGVKWKYY